MNIHLPYGWVIYETSMCGGHSRYAYLCVYITCLCTKNYGTLLICKPWKMYVCLTKARSLIVQHLRDSACFFGLSHNEYGLAALLNLGLS